MYARRPTQVPDGGCASSNGVRNMTVVAASLPCPVSSTDAPLSSKNKNYCSLAASGHQKRGIPHCRHATQRHDSEEQAAVQDAWKGVTSNTPAFSEGGQGAVTGAENDQNYYYYFCRPESGTNGTRSPTAVLLTRELTESGFMVRLSDLARDVRTSRRKNRVQALNKERLAERPQPADEI